MRWTRPECPRVGETRVVAKFFLFPKRIKRTTVWLERASYLQQWRERGLRINGDPEGSGPHWVPGWVDIKWME